MKSKERRSIIRKAVFPIAGVGLRMRPISRVVQKELLPIGTKAMIHFAVQEAIDSGIEEIHFLMRKNQRHDYFVPETEDASEPHNSSDSDGVRSTTMLLRQASFSYHVLPAGVGGLGAALLAAKGLISLGHEPFALVLFDDFVVAKKPCLRQIIEAYESVRADVFAVTPIPRNEIPQFGVVRCHPFEHGIARVLAAVEKPDHRIITGRANGIVGRYILTPRIFEVLRQCVRKGVRNSNELTPALDALAKLDSVFAARFQGQYIHAGTEAGYLRAVVHYALRRSKFAPVIWNDILSMIRDNRRGSPRAK